MDVEAVTTFFALLAVLAIAVVVSVAVAAAVALLGGGRSDGARAWLDALGQVALPAAFAVALTCTLGSLYLSEVAHFPPCELCWYQRIAMYPLTVILGVAALRRDAAVKWYVVPLTAIGGGISIYHYLLERFPDSISSSCSTDVPCTTVWVWKFHFLSIPGMAFVGSALITTLVLLAARRSRVPAESQSIDHERVAASATGEGHT